MKKTLMIAGFAALLLVAPSAAADDLTAAEVMTMVTDPCDGTRGQLGFSLAGVRRVAAERYPLSLVCDEDARDLEYLRLLLVGLIQNRERLAMSGLPEGTTVTRWTDAQEAALQRRVWNRFETLIDGGKSFDEAILAYNDELTSK